MELPKHALEANIEASIRKEGLFDPAGRVLVSVSGGADSMALLHLLLALSGRLSLEICVAHYDHGIRGEASAADARFVQDACDALSVPCVLGRGDVPEMARQWKTSLEDAARRARYAFLEQAREQVGARYIALGHNSEDQAETLLLHLVRGSGISGLAGMRPRSGNRVRPLLFTSHAMLEEYLRDIGVTWREDITNQDMRYTRNFLRGEVFPLLARINPRVAEAMGRTARILQSAADMESERANALLTGRVKRMPYGAFWLHEGLSITPEALRAFALWSGVPALDAEQTDAFLRREMGGLPGGFSAVFTKKRLHLIAPAWQALALSEDDFLWEADAGGNCGDGITTQSFDAQALSGAHFRYRRAGDIFAPLNGGGTQKLKQTLRDAGIDKPFRDVLPVLARENRILWIVGVKPARDAAITSQTKERIRICFKGTLPWEIQKEANDWDEEDME